MGIQSPGSWIIHCWTSLFRVVCPFSIYIFLISTYEIYILGFYWRRSGDVTSRLVNGYLLRAISAFCETLAPHSFAVPIYQSKQTQIHNFLFDLPCGTTCRLLCHLFRGSDSSRLFRLEIDLCPNIGMIFTFSNLDLNDFIRQQLLAYLWSNRRSWDPFICGRTLWGWKCQFRQCFGTGFGTIYNILYLIILRVTSIILHLTVNALDPLPSLLRHIILQLI